MWHNPSNTPPETEFDYRRLRLRIVRDSGVPPETLTFHRLDSLPLHSCMVAARPGSGQPPVLKWTGASFSDVAELLGVKNSVASCRLVGSDGYSIEERVAALTRPHVILAWFLNGEPIPAAHGAPLRLINLYQNARRNLKAISEIRISSV